MRKIIVTLVAAVAAIALTPLLTPSWRAHADPVSDYCNRAWAGKPYANVTIPACEKECVQYSLHCGEAATASPPQSRAPAQTPQAPANAAPPSAAPVQAPTINPPGPAAPKNASPIKPPKRVQAPPDAVTAAKSAPAVRVDPAHPPARPTQGDFHQLVQNVLRDHGGNVDVVHVGNQTLVRPRVWDWVDYDADHHPALYNPLTEATTFRYFYDGAYREVFVAAGTRVVLDIATSGVFPFTAVSDSYVASGSFYAGGVTPQLYRDVSIAVPAYNQTVQAGQVAVVGHDDSLPAGSQDIFLLDDSTLAWGKVNDPSSGTQITVNKTQSVPGVAPIDNGALLVALTASEQPSDNTWWLWLLGSGVLVIVASVGLVAWIVVRRRRHACPTVGA